MSPQPTNNPITDAASSLPLQSSARAGNQAPKLKILPAPDAGSRGGSASDETATPLSQSIVAGITGLLDVAITVTAGVLIYLVYVLDEESAGLQFYLYTTGLYAFFLVQSLYAAGMYRFGRLIDPVKHVPRVIAVGMLLFLLFIAAGFAMKISASYSRVWAFSWLAVTLGGIITSRFFVAGLVHHWARAGRIRRRIVIYGGGEQGERLIRHIEKLKEPWNEIVGVFDDRRNRIGDKVVGYPVLGNLDDLLEWCRRHRADEILLAMPWSAEKRLLGITRCLAVLPANIRLSPEVVGAKLMHERTSHQFGVPMLNIMEKPVSGWGAVTKQVLDFLLGSLFVLLSLPILALAALAIRLESRGPIFFRQQRYGFNHQLIEVFKFRTMYTDRLDHKAEQLTQRDDPRVTKVGAILRRFSIDELPQLFNVLRGEMSVVGPRPHALHAKAGGKLYDDVIDEYAVRHKVKPGITGWAQVNGWRGNTETEEDLIGRVEHDLYYIENWSVLFDLSIILRTAWVVLTGKNSY